MIQDRFTMFSRLFTCCLFSISVRFLKLIFHNLSSENTSLQDPIIGANFKLAKLIFYFLVLKTSCEHVSEGIQYNLSHHCFFIGAMVMMPCHLTSAHALHVCCPLFINSIVFIQKNKFFMHWACPLWQAETKDECVDDNRYPPVMTGHATSFHLQVINS